MSDVIKNCIEPFKIGIWAANTANIPMERSDEGIYTVNIGLGELG
jgi:hypothetical protein